MKFAALTSIAHNLADSLASGIGLLIGVYNMDVFGEAARSPSGAIEVDLLAGRCTEGDASPSLERAVGLYASQALPQLCAREGAAVADFRLLKARFWTAVSGPQCEVTVESVAGRRQTRRYEGLPLRRIRIIDARGRVRSRRSWPPPAQAASGSGVAQALSASPSQARGDLPK